MPNYKDSFKLDIDDVELIENALRTFAALKTSEQHSSHAEQMTGTPEIARQVHNLLGKIHNQKNFYACAIPSGKSRRVNDPVG